MQVLYRPAGVVRLCAQRTDRQRVLHMPPGISPHKSQPSWCNAQDENKPHLEAPEVLHARANHGGP